MLSPYSAGMHRVMTLAALIDPPAAFAPPPPGARNIRLGARVEGPGGAWVPCATSIGAGLYVSSLFRVGPGQRQVCAADRPTRSVDEAFAHALELARTAAA